MTKIKSIKSNNNRVSKRVDKTDKALSGNVRYGRKCYVCGYYGHIASNCKSYKTQLASQMFMIDLALSQVGKIKYNKSQITRYYTSGKVMRDYTLLGMKKYIEMNMDEVKEANYAVKLSNANRRINNLERLTAERFAEMGLVAESRVKPMIKMIKEECNNKVEDLLKTINIMKNQMALMKQENQMARLKEGLYEENESKTSTTQTTKSTKADSAIYQYKLDIKQKQIDSKNRMRIIRALIDKNKNKSYKIKALQIEYKSELQNCINKLVVEQNSLNEMRVKYQKMVVYRDNLKMRIEKQVQLYVKMDESIRNYQQQIDKSEAVLQEQQQKLDKINQELRSKSVKEKLNPFDNPSQKQSKEITKQVKKTKEQIEKENQQYKQNFKEWYITKFGRNPPGYQ